MNERRSLVGILSALDVEYRAVRERLVTVHRLDSVAGTLFETGTLYAGGEVVLALTGKGNHPAAVIAERAISTFSPIAVLFAGVAEALTPDLNLSDIVVATRVYAHRGAAGGGGPIGRPRVWEIDHRIELAAHRVNRRFDQVRFGPIASGEVLDDGQDSPERRWVGEHYEDPLTIDMEAAGVAQAGQFRGVPIGVIRAISDRAHGVRSETDATRHEIRDVTSETDATTAGTRGAATATGGTEGGARGTSSGIEGRRWQAEAARRAAGFAAALAADLIARPPSLGRGSGQGRRAAAEGVGEASEGSGQPGADVDAEVRDGGQGGRHGASAGNGNGDVRDDGRSS
jgi:8-oxo-dGTP diphosphatase